MNYRQFTRGTQLLTGAHHHLGIMIFTADFTFAKSKQFSRERTRTRRFVNNVKLEHIISRSQSIPFNYLLRQSDIIEHVLSIILDLMLAGRGVHPER